MGGSVGSLSQWHPAQERGELSGLESAEAFERWLDPVRDIPWMIRSPGIWDCRGAACDPEATLRTVRYLARYVNRIAISNSRLLGIEGDKVLLRYKDYRDGNRWKVKAIDGVRFIRRFLRHLLPPRLRHIRRCGFMGARFAGEAGLVAEPFRPARSFRAPGGAGRAGGRDRGARDGRRTDAPLPRMPGADAPDRLHAAAHGDGDPGNVADRD